MEHTKKKQEETRSIRDMTEGSPAGLIIAFALPMLIGTLFQQFYSMVDAFMVGRYMGVDSLAAVGSTSAIFFMVNGFVIGNSAGFAIPVAQKFGAGDYTGLRRFTANAAWLGILFSVVITGGVCALTGKILVWMQTPQAIMAETYTYIIIIFAGIPVMYLYNLTASIIRALGDSKTPLYFLMIAAVLNIVLDYVSIGVLHMGVAGPAYATVISQVVSGMLCLIYMGKKFAILHMSREEAAFSRHHCQVLLSMGIPMGLQYSITAIGSVILQTAVNGLGAVSMASVTAGQKLSSFFVAVTDALGMAMATYCGQNVGAGKLDRVWQGVKAATLMGLVYAAAIFVFMIFAGGALPRLFVDPKAANVDQVVSQARTFLLWNSAFYWALIFVNVWRNSIQGMGFSGFSICAGICEMFARALIGFAAVPAFGFVAACTASPLAWIAATAFLIPGLWHCLKRLERVFQSQKTKDYYGS